MNAIKHSFKAATHQGTNTGAKNAVVIAAKQAYSRLEFSAAGNSDKDAKLQVAEKGDNVVIEGSFDRVNWFALCTLKFDSETTVSTAVKTKHVRMTASGFATTDTWNVAVAFVD
jgi:hypothetical protein